MVKKFFDRTDAILLCFPVFQPSLYHMDLHCSGICWATKHFTELNLDELYAILKLRSQIFIVEQGFRFLEIDGKDQLAYHVMAWRTSESDLEGKNAQRELLATSRLFAKDLCYEGYQGIGRVACSENSRGKGIGKRLMELSVNECKRVFGEREDIKINAQHRLKSFYELTGFRQVGEIYQINGVDHIAMIRYRNSSEGNGDDSVTGK